MIDPDPWQIAVDILDGGGIFAGPSSCLRSVTPVASTLRTVSRRRQRRRPVFTCPACHLALPATRRCGCDPEEGQLK